MSAASMNTGNKIIAFVLVLLGLGIFYLLTPVLIPFGLGALLAYLCNPLVTQLMRLHLSRSVAVIIVSSLLLIVIVVCILILIPLIQNQIDTISGLVPNMTNMAQNQILPWLKANLGLHGNFSPDAIKKMITDNILQTSDFASWLVQTIMHSGKALFEVILDLVLIPIVTIYLLRDWNGFINGIRELIPRRKERTVAKLARECDHVLSAFFRGQLIVMLVLGVYYSISLSLVGLQTGVVIGILVALVSIVPYLGFIVGIVVASLAALIQFNDLSSLIWIFVIFGIGHAFENFILTPRLIGDRIGLHPVAVIFSILAGGCLFGFFGVLLALPVAAVVMVLLRHLQGKYHESEMYKA